MSAQSIRAYAEGNDLAERDIIFYLVDLDNFKKVNDLYGHDGGDRVLIESARRIASAIRNSDLLVRWGGEEFLVVSRSTDRRQAGILAQRVLDAFRAKPFAIDSAGQVNQTCSIGWAAFPWFEDDVDGIGYEGVLKFADRALYRAKKAGKNQAVGMVHSGDGAMTSGAAEALADAAPNPSLRKCGRASNSPTSLSRRSPHFADLALHLAAAYTSPHPLEVMVYARQ